MSEREKGEVVGKSHGAAVKEAIEDHKKAHMPHAATGSGPASIVPPPAFQGPGGTIA